MPEVTSLAVHGICYAIARNGIEVVMSWTNALRWADARALIHIPDQIIIARLWQAHALTLILVPILIRRAKFWSGLAKAFAVLSAPVRLVAIILRRPSGASTGRLKTDTAA